MRVLVLASLAFVVAFRSGAPASQPAPAERAVEAGGGGAAAKPPQIEQILVPIYSRARAKNDASMVPYWGTLTDGEVFREIRALSREGLVQNAGQPAPPLRILREFFAPNTDPNQDGLLGHYVFIVECTKSDLKHVYVAGPK